MARKPRVIVSVTNDLYTDQRVHKVCTYIQSRGYDVLLVGRLRKNSLPLEERTYATKRMKLLFDKGALFYASYNFRLFLFLLFRRVAILVSNDLDTLLGNYAAKAFKPNTQIAYDSHEYFTEVPELQGRKTVKAIWESIERWIFPKLKKVYTVNASIAELYSKKYKKEIKVLRNISPRWTDNQHSTRAELGLPENEPLIILQGAGINVDRGAEEVIEAMKNIDQGVLIIVGDGDVIPKLKVTVQKEGLENKVLFFGRQPYQRMMQYTRHASIGLSLDKADNMNYLNSLPNKLFDYMHAGTPVLVSKLPEVEKVVIDNEIGVVIDQVSPELIAQALEKLLSHPDQLERFKANCYKAAELLNWEKEVEVLDDIYPKVGV